MHASPSACSLQRGVRRHAHNSDAYAWFDMLTGPELFEQTESLLPQHRERMFPPTETLSMFLAQALSADRSCQKAVNEAAVKRMAGGLRPCSTQHGRLLPRARTLAVADGECTGALQRGLGRGAHARAVALAGSAGTVGGRHHRATARHPGQSGRVSASAHPEARFGVSLVPAGGHCVSG